LTITLQRATPSSLQKVKITISIQFQPQQHLLQVTVKDSGLGFDFQQQNHDHDHEKYFGRGITLLRELCDPVEYQGMGNSVEVTFTI
jgi:anti-sigma regulatory factor (Ser/Thr protein kinase)